MKEEKTGKIKNKNCTIFYTFAYYTKWYNTN